MLLLILLVGGGFLYYRGVLRPDPQRLEDWALPKLNDIFGPGVVHGPASVDLLEGVYIPSLEVPGTTPGTPGLRAASVEIRHDPLALSAGVMRLRSVVIRKPQISMHE